MLDATAMEGGFAVDYGTFDLTPRPALPKGDPSPEQLAQLARVLAAAPQIDIPVEHFFAPGMYVRKCTIQADAYVIGKKHRHQHPTMLVKGEATINTDKGMVRIAAPHIWISQEGAQRALYTHTECEFVTVHLNPDDTQDLEAIEADVIVPQTLAELTQEPARIAEFSDALQGVYA
jgi:hypothetical protein